MENPFIQITAWVRITINTFQSKFPVIRLQILVSKTQSSKLNGTFQTESIVLNFGEFIEIIPTYFWKINQMNAK